MPCDGEDLLKKLSHNVEKIYHQMNNLSSSVSDLKKTVEELKKSKVLTVPLKKEIEEMTVKLEELVCSHGDLLTSQESTKRDIENLCTELKKVKAQLTTIQNVFESNLLVTSVEVSSDTVDYLCVKCPKINSQKRHSWPSGEVEESLSIGKMIERMAEKIRSIEREMLQLKKVETSKDSQATFIEIAGLRKFVKQQIEENRMKQEEFEARSRTYSTDSGYSTSTPIRPWNPPRDSSIPCTSLISSSSPANGLTGSFENPSTVNQIGTCRDSILEEDSQTENNTPQRGGSLSQTTRSNSLLRTAGQSYSLSRDASLYEYQCDPRFDLFLESLLKFLSSTSTENN